MVISKYFADPCGTIHSSFYVIETFEITSPIQLTDKNELYPCQANYYIVPTGLWPFGLLYILPIFSPAGTVP
jgi:hypothetical protein